MASNLDMFDDLVKRMDTIKKDTEASTTKEFKTALKRGLTEGTVTSTENSITVSEDVANSSETVIDMKDYFRKSPKAKKTSTGGWYMVVPIRRYASRKMKNQARGMSSMLYKDMNRAPKSTTVISDYLYDNRTITSPIEELNYTPKSNKITKMRNPRGRGSVYVAFRTVSNKSAPNSWLKNRDKADPNNLTAEVERILNQTRNNIK